MDDLKKFLLTPRARSLAFLGGWAMLGLAVLSQLILHRAGITCPLGLVGIGLLETSNALAVRASLWRIQSGISETRKLRSSVEGKSRDFDQMLTSIGRGISKTNSGLDGVNSRTRAIVNQLQQRGMKVTDEGNNGAGVEAILAFQHLQPRLAAYLLGLGGSQVDPILLVYETNDEKKVETISRLLGVEVVIVSPVSDEAKVWDIRKFQRIAIIPSSANPKPILPFSWVDARAKLHFLSASLDEEYLRELSHGVPVKFGSVRSGMDGVEFKVRRELG